VTSVSRHEPDERIDGVAYVIGSVLDGDVLAAAVADHDVVIEAVSPRGDMSGRVEGVVDQLVELAPRAGARLGVIGGVSSLKVEEGGPRVFDVNEVDPGVLPEIETGLALLETLKAAPDDVDWFYVSPPLSYGSWVPAPDTGSYRLSDEILLKDDEGNSTISAADLARAIVDEIEQPQYRRRRFHAAH
jgi:putative NADH-flavin reductase